MGAHPRRPRVVSGGGRLTGLRLTVERRLAAPREAVFRAWTDPDALRRWWAAGPGWDTPEASVDLRVGGRYRLAMRDPATGAVHAVAGEYAEVSPPARLVYSWAWEGDGATGPVSRVTVEFRDDGAGTLVVITHEGLADEPDRGRHAHGWDAVLDNLEGRAEWGAASA